jgi:hypothetical protein
MTAGTAVVVAVMAAQPVADALLARLEGHWTGEGTVLSRPATLQMEWAWTLDEQFLELRFRNEMGGSTPTRSKAAPSIGRRARAAIPGSTTRAPSVRLTPRREGDALVSAWGTPDTEMGETTYRLVGDTRLEVTDRVRERDGSWRTFGQSVLMKR